MNIGIQMSRKSNCEICRSLDSTTFFENYHNSVPSVNVICNKCGFIFNATYKAYTSLENATSVDRVQKETCGNKASSLELIQSENIAWDRFKSCNQFNRSILLSRWKAIRDWLWFW